MMVKIAICDDNSVHLRRAELLIRETLADETPEILLYSDTAALRGELESGAAAPDIAVLDIRMEGMDGIALADAVNRLLPECQIVFLTGFADYAPEVYATRHIWFVLKDRMEEYLPRAIRKAMAVLAAGPAGAELVFRRDRKTHKVPLDSVLVIERVGRKFRIVCRTETYPDVKLVTDLRSPGIGEQILRCHQGYWVNEPFIRMLERDALVMENDMRVPVSRTFRAGVRERFFAARRL